MTARGGKAKGMFRLGLNAVGALILAGGCANILGISDLEADDDETIIVRGGNAGSSGSGGKGGGTGKGGSTGQAGATGDAGSGTGGAPPASGPLNCDGTPLEVNEDIVRGCILYESCYVPASSISSCVTYNIPDAYAGRACAENAMDCSDIVDCRHSAFFHPDAPVTCTDTTNYCDGNIAVNCDSDPQEYTDCTLEGGTCDDTTGVALCRVVDTCPEAEEGLYACSPDNELYYCFQGVGYGLDCGTLPATCDPTDLICYYSQASCAGADSVVCEGSTAEECYQGKATSYPCGSVGLDCVEANDTAYCLAPGCTPDDWIQCQESCSGSELTFCYSGVEVTVDCQDYGFDTCRQDTLDGLTVAVCAFSL
jgi:hypothetical protein